MPQYRIEISKNSRAVCKDSVCKANQDKIQKGEVRFGTWVEIQDHGSWAWKHWGCVSGSQLLNLRETCEQGDGEYDFDLIDGYDELADHSDVQEKIRRCVKQSHIDPEDFKGDPEKNKPGEKGIHLTAKQKAAKEAAAADKDSEDAKPAKKSAKRGRKKDVDDEPAEPKSKKSKTASKPDKAEAPKKAVRGSKAKAKVESESDDDAPITTKKKQTPSKAVASKSSGKASATAKTAGKTGRRAKAAVVSDDDEEDEKPVQAKANTKARRTSRGKA